MYYALIVAGGEGIRMGSPLPKQFIEIKSYPVLYYTLNAFHEAIPGIQIILVLPESHLEYWKQLVLKYNINIPHKTVLGGKTRYQSVKNGLREIPLNTMVAIHDGVRPLVSSNLINHCFETCKAQLAVIPVLPLSDSIRLVEGTISKPLNRSQYKLVQTPQCFNSDIIKKAYEQIPFSESLTDDAMVAEAFGQNITLIEGERNNIKITTPEDLRYVEYVLGAHLPN